MNAPEIFGIRQTPSQKTASGSAPRERRRGNQSYDLTTVMPLPAKQQPSLLPSLYPSLLLRRTDTRTLNRQKRETWTDFLIPLRQHNLYVHFSNGKWLWGQDVHSSLFVIELQGVSERISSYFHIFKIKHLHPKKTTAALWGDKVRILSQFLDESHMIICGILYRMHHYESKLITLLITVCWRTGDFIHNQVKDRWCSC